MYNKILITGGSGFIGTNLIDFYLTEGIEVLNLDIKPPRNDEHCTYWRCVDIENYNLLLKEVNNFKPDCVLNMAAKTDLRGKTISDYSTNTSGVQNIIKVCNSVTTVNRVIFASSMLVCRAGYIPINDDDFCPPNLYGESKVIGEKLIRTSDANSRFEWVIVRPTSIWGPWFGPTYRSFFELIMKGKYFNFTGKMSEKTYGYIGNIVYQINQVLNSDETPGRTYYLGDYESTKVDEWAREISAEVNKEILTIPRPIVWLAAKIGDILQEIGIKFPMSSFRFKNMTTDNVIPLEETRKIAPLTIFDRNDGNRRTIFWMKTHYLKNK